MPTKILELLYHGDRPAAEKLARKAPLLTIFEASALGALEALIERCEEDAAGINAYSDDGWTPLHLAAYFGNNAAVKDLLRRGARIDARARNGSEVTPLHSACAGHHVLVASTLIAAGADVNAEQTGGYRPLDSAIQSGNDELIDLLMSAGATAGRPA
jgi:ankyrin repeat protein